MLASESRRVGLQPLPYVRVCLLSAILVGSLVFAAPIQQVLRPLSRAAFNVIQRTFCRIMCWAIGIKVTSNGSLQEPGPHLIVANHVSWTDILALTSLAPMTFLAKSEVSKWPLLGLLARLQGTVFVRRGDRQQIASVNEEIAGVLRGGGNLVVFPEGTSTHGVMDPSFKSSHFEVATFADVMVVPVAIFYTDENGQADVGWYGDMTFMPHLWRLLRRRNVECRVFFDNPIGAGNRSRKSLASEAQERVRHLLIEARDARSLG